jgi:hypothetical protein
MQATDSTQEFNRIFERPTSDLEKLLTAFAFFTRQVVLEADREIQLAHAMGDQQGVVRVQIKKETIKHAQSFLENGYLRITGRRFTARWD